MAERPTQRGALPMHVGKGVSTTDSRRPRSHLPDGAPADLKDQQGMTARDAVLTKRMLNKGQDSLEGAATLT